MKNLFNFELRRLLKQKTFYICLAGIIACCLIVVLTYKLISSLGEGLDAETFGVQVTGSYFLLNALSQSNLEIFLGVFIAIFVCSDFGEGTIRNIISRGFTRENVLVSKYITCLIASFSMAILNLLFGFVFGTAIGGIGEDWSINFLPLILAQVLVVFAYSSVFVFFSLLLKKLGGAITIAVVLPIVLPLLFTLIKVIFSKVDFDFTNLWLSGCMISLANPNIENTALVISLLTPTVYIVISIVLSFVFFKKAEV